MFILAAWALLCGGEPRAATQSDLQSLAERHNLVRTTDASTGREILRGTGVHLVLAPGLAIALWNGEIKALSRPVRIQDGRVVVPPEIDSLFAARAPARPISPAPVVRSRVSEQTPRRFKLVLDAGHGGAHTGGKGQDGLLEKDVNLDVALRLQRLLEDYGIDVVMTRTRDVHFDQDVDDDLQRRVHMANRADADFFLSIHSNWHPGTHARGFEVYVPRDVSRSREESLIMAQEIRNQFRRNLDTEDRGIKEAGFRVLRGTEAPAVLVELEFISNARGERELGSPSHRQKLAELLFQAVKRFVSRRS